MQSKTFGQIFWVQSNTFVQIVFGAKQDFSLNILSAKQYFCSKLVGSIAKQDSSSNILDAKQVFCLKILVVKTSFIKSLGAKQDFCSTIMDAKQVFVHKFVVQSNTFVQTFGVQSKTLVQTFLVQSKGHRPKASMKKKTCEVGLFFWSPHPSGGASPEVGPETFTMNNTETVNFRELAAIHHTRCKYINVYVIYLDYQCIHILYFI